MSEHEHDGQAAVAVVDAAAEVKSNGFKDLSAADILGANDMRVERFFVPEWKGYVYLKTISGEARDRFEAAMVVGDKQSTENIRAKFLVEALCDQNGVAYFTQADVYALGQKSSAGLTRCYNKASHMNALSNQDVDDLAKNSGSGATDIS